MHTHTCLAASVLTLNFAAALAATPTSQAAAPSVTAALDGERLGLYDGSQFRYDDGGCGGCAPKQALWYFQGEGLAVPRRPAGPATTSPVPAPDASPALPDLVWLGAPQLIRQATLAPSGRTLQAPGAAPLAMQLAPRIASNRSYFNAGSLDFFRQRDVRVRGTLRDVAGKPTFEARTIWPRDFVIDAASMRRQPLSAGDSLAGFVRHENGGARSAYATRLIWERQPGAQRDWRGKPVLAVVLNGAQGDDDEAYGGHFAVATGRMGRNGEWADWMVNNFYNLDSYSEKGVIASMVPMDNYLMDLNSGQQYYRPSTMLVAVLRDARTAQAFQGSMQDTFRRFYRHDFRYRHAAANCAGISVDVFKGLGWQLPEQGPTSRLKALGAYGYKAAKDMSLASGHKAYDYFTEEQTRLYPAVAFAALGQDLLKLLGGGPQERALSPYERQLQEDVEALVLVRIPQVPSSRAFGSAPVFSIDEYLARAPQDESQWQIVPVPPRPFPPELREGPALAEESALPVPAPVGGLLLGVAGVGAGWHWRRRKNSRREAWQRAAPA
ncbi:hypothetical protein ASD15_15315 [Massilia sp. Root351]|jgi:hypothetical protein|uniref:hypothetical protein n=1 Tax=Massilia sp. Root351 TaxID=1736522 RepID=UPI00070D1CA6|nr:hypothetical protein [Massilia sp. Root351]KQV80235.1 hypothetical protein ASD15_15315 [Massilia sp. Root351]